MSLTLVLCRWQIMGIADSMAFALATKTAHAPLL
jgi:hypothetical protein